MIRSEADARTIHRTPSLILPSDDTRARKTSAVAGAAQGASIRQSDYPFDLSVELDIGIIRRSAKRLELHELDVGRPQSYRGMLQFLGHQAAPIRWTKFGVHACDPGSI